MDSLSATRPTPPTLSDAGWYTRPVSGSMLMAEGMKGEVKKRPPWLNESSGSEESLKRHLIFRQQILNAIGTIIQVAICKNSRKLTHQVLS